MTRLPNADRAVLDVQKLERYCLDPAHPRGRHKARVFRNALGIGQRDATWLRDALLAGARQAQAQEIEADVYGTRWRADIEVRRQNRHSVIRTLWIVRPDEETPRFVTCWVL